MARLLLDRLSPANAAVLDSERDRRIDIVDEITGALFSEALRRADQKKAPAARLLGTHRRVIERFQRRDSVSPAPEQTPGSFDEGDSESNEDA